MQRKYKVYLLATSFTFVLFLLATGLSGILVADGCSTTYTSSISETILNPSSCCLSGEILPPGFPETKIALDGILGDNGWYISDVTVTLIATDDFFVASTEYSFDGTTWISYTGSFIVMTEGITTIYYNSTDDDGNVEPTMLQEIKIDKTHPKITIDLDGTLGDNGWYTSDVIVTINATDPHSGVELLSVSARDDEGTWSYYDSLSGDGAKSIEITFTISIESRLIYLYAAAFDIAYNWGDRYPNIKIDKTLPVTTISTERVLEGVRVTLDATDSLSGIGNKFYSFDQVTWESYIEPFILTAGGIVDVYYYSIDVAGNAESKKKESIFVDDSPPETKISLDGNLGNNEWYTSDVTVTLIATDEFTLVAATAYSLDGVTWIGYNTPFTISTEGEITVYYNSTDVAGFIETTKSQKIKIDKTNPEIALTYVRVAGFGSIVSMDASDAVSGLTSVSYGFDGVTWITYADPFSLTSGGIIPVFYQAIDVAGNVASQVEMVEVDILPPVTTVTLYGTPGLGDWWLSDVVVTLLATDDLMGVDLIAYSFDGVTWTEYIDPFTISDEGLTTLYFNATDTVGNMESPNIIEIWIDKTNPVTTLTIQQPIYGTDPTYVSSITDFELDAFDAVSGVDRTEYRIDSGDWITYMSAFNVPDLGLRTVYYRSTDVAGNVEPEQSVDIIVNASETIYAGEVSGVYSDPVYLEAQLIDIATQLPISGKIIIFVIGSQTDSAVTDLDGFADVTIILNQPAGTYIVSASFAGNDDYLSSSDTDEFTLEKETAYAFYTGSTVVPTNADIITLRATIFDDADGYWGDLSLAYITFAIYADPFDPDNPVLVEGPYTVEVTDILGVGVVILEIPNLPESNYFVKISFEPDDNDYYQGLDSELRTITVTKPACKFVTGGGWIRDPSGIKGSFGFVVKYKKNGQLKGTVIYQYKDGDWRYIIKCTKMLGLAIDDNHAFFEGLCKVIKINRKSCEFVCCDDYMFRIDVWDYKKCQGKDVFQITIYDKEGLIYHKAGFDPYGYLEGGCIKIHSCRWRCCVRYPRKCHCKKY